MTSFIWPHHHIMSTVDVSDITVILKPLRFSENSEDLESRFAVHRFQRTF